MRLSCCAYGREYLNLLACPSLLQNSSGILLLRIRYRIQTALIFQSLNIEFKSASSPDMATYDRGPSVAPIVVPVFVLAVLAVAARTYSRRLIRQSRTASDFTIVGGLIFSASLTGMILYGRYLKFTGLSASTRLTTCYRSSDWTWTSHSRRTARSDRATPYNPLRRLHPIRHCDFSNQDIHLAPLSFSIPDTRDQLGNKNHCCGERRLGIRNSSGWNSLLSTGQGVLGYHNHGKEMHQHDCFLHRQLRSTRRNRYRHLDTAD